MQIVNTWNMAIIKREYNIQSIQWYIIVSTLLNMYSILFT